MTEEEIENTEFEQVVTPVEGEVKDAQTAITEGEEIIADDAEETEVEMA